MNDLYKHLLNITWWRHLYMVEQTSPVHNKVHLQDYAKVIISHVLISVCNGSNPSMHSFPGFSYEP